MEGAPEGFDVDEMIRELKSAEPGVVEIHHVHVWALTPEKPLITLHALIDGDTDHDEALRRLHGALEEKFGLAHATIQIERATGRPALKRDATEPCPARALALKLGQGKACHAPPALYYRVACPRFTLLRGGPHGLQKMTAKSHLNTALATTAGLVAATVWGVAFFMPAPVLHSLALAAPSSSSSATRCGARAAAARADRCACPRSRSRSVRPAAAGDGACAGGAAVTMVNNSVPLMSSALAPSTLQSLGATFSDFCAVGGPSATGRRGRSRRPCRRRPR